MRSIIWLIIIFALAAGLSLVAADNTGFVLFVTESYKVQIALNLFVVFLVVGFIAAYMALGLLRGTVRLPGAVGRFRARRRREGGQRNLRDSLRFYLEGRYAQSLKRAAKAHRVGEGEGLAALLAARAAHEMRDAERYDEWMEQAAKVDKTRTARLMTEAELALDSRRYDEASACLTELNQSGERHVAAQRLALRNAEASGQWGETARLARQLKKHKAISEDAAADLVRRAHIEALTSRVEDGAELEEYWKSIPSAELGDHQMLEQAVPVLIRGGRAALARKLVEDLLDREWDSELARTYADCCVKKEEVAAGLVKAEAWLKEWPRDADLLLTLGRLCMRMELWGKAQSYLEASLGVRHDMETNLALARLFEELERPVEAQQFYRKAAELAMG